jgi:hypothetical protein
VEFEESGDAVRLVLVGGLWAKLESWRSCIIPGFFSQVCL